MAQQLLIGVASIIVLGVGASWLAWRINVPSILVLLLAGFIAGPLTGFLDPDQLLGDVLFPIVSLSVAIILFEGGLSLRRDELAKIGGVVGLKLDDLEISVDRDAERAEPTLTPVEPHAILRVVLLPLALDAQRSAVDRNLQVVQLQPRHLRLHAKGLALLGNVYRRTSTRRCDAGTEQVVGPKRLIENPLKLMTTTPDRKTTTHSSENHY